MGKSNWFYGIRPDLTRTNAIRLSESAIGTNSWYKSATNNCKRKVRDAWIVAFRFATPVKR